MGECKNSETTAKNVSTQAGERGDCLPRRAATLFESNSKHFGWLAFDDIRNTARTAFLNDPDGVCRVAQKPGYDPKIACLRSVATVARHDLVSGREHLDYNRLTMQGDGKRAIYRIALAELVKVGALTAEDRIRCCRELDEDIGLEQHGGEAFPEEGTRMVTDYAALLQKHPQHFMDASWLPADKQKMIEIFKMLWLEGAEAQRKTVEDWWCLLSRFQAGVGAIPITWEISKDNPIVKVWRERYERVNPLLEIGLAENEIHEREIERLKAGGPRLK